MSTMTSITDFGAVGDNATDNTAAIQKAIDTSTGERRGPLLVPPGEYLTGSLRLRSGLHLHLAAGAVLRCTGDASRVSHFQSPVPSRMDVKPWRAFLFGRDLSDIRIEGAGTIDGGGYHDAFQDNVDNSPDRPYGLFLVNCRDIVVRDLHLRDSGFWMQRYLQCDRIRLSGLRVWNHCNRNNDGIDIDSCKDVLISDCLIDSSDDGICLKSEGERICSNVTVQNCIIATHASAIKLGTGSVGGFENIAVTNCVVRRSESDHMYHPLEAWGGLAGIDLATVDGGPLRNVTVSNVVIDGVETPLFLRLGKRLSGDAAWMGYGGQNAEDHRSGGSRGARIRGEGSMEQVQLRGITARNVGPIASIVSGYEGNPVRDITLRDIDITLGRPGNEADLQAQPEWAPERYPCNRTPANGHNLPVAGLYLRHIDGLCCDNVRVHLADGDPRPGVKLEQVTNIRRRALVVTGVTPGAADVVEEG